ncbi:hypothetical protein [Alteribacillus sp. HJP-4]|uniref:hypothetical protein n=1 Tax=Alteribacillus sp. HJP-4 TaxID=2775394 RepID=UPI0035CD387B
MPSAAIKIFSMAILSLLILSGCMFPESERAENQVPYENQLASVQQAVEQYREDNGVLPIQNRDENIPEYQKYVVDFRKMMPRYLQEPPGNSFESGGPFQYVIIDPEEEAEVKVIDLRVMNEIQAFEREIQAYIKKNEYAPIKEAVGPNVYKIDMERLDYHREAKVESPYFNTTLPLLINQNGKVLIDYSIDLNIALREHEHNFEPGDNIMPVLTDNYPIVPAFSVPYTIDNNNEPEFLETD